MRARDEGVENEGAETVGGDDSETGSVTKKKGNKNWCQSSPQTQIKKKATLQHCVIE